MMNWVKLSALSNLEQLAATSNLCKSNHYVLLLVLLPTSILIGVERLTLGAHAQRGLR